MISRVQELEKNLDTIIRRHETQDKEFGITKGLLQELSKTFLCDWATYWKVESYSLRPVAIWNSDDRDVRKLNDDTATRSLSMSEGTAGHVWRSRRPIWSTDIVVDMCLPRSLDANAIGFNSGIWFAVKTDRAVYGVIEMLGSKLESPSEELLLMVEHLGIKLGRLIESPNVHS